MIHNSSDQYSSKVESVSLERAKAIGIEFGKLISEESLSEQQEYRLEEILTLATTNELVDFWVTLCTCHYGMECGLLSEESQKYYADQNACLRERLGTSPLATNQNWIELEKDLHIHIKAIRKANAEQKHIESDASSENKVSSENSVQGKNQ